MLCVFKEMLKVKCKQKHFQHKHLAIKFVNNAEDDFCVISEQNLNARISPELLSDQFSPVTLESCSLGWSDAENSFLRGSSEHNNQRVFLCFHNCLFILPSFFSILYSWQKDAVADGKFSLNSAFQKFPGGETPKNFMSTSCFQRTKMNSKTRDYFHWRLRNQACVTK